MSKIQFEESEEILITNEPTINQLGKTTHSVVSTNLREGIYGSGGNVLANLLMKVDFSQPKMANFIFKLPMSDKSHKQFSCKVSTNETLSSVMPEIYNVVIEKVTFYNPSIVKSTPLAINNKSTNFNANAPAFQPLNEKKTFYPALTPTSNLIIPSAPPENSITYSIPPSEKLKKKEPSSYRDSHANPYDEQSQFECDPDDEECQQYEPKGIMRQSRDKAKRNLAILPAENDPPPNYTVERAPSVGRNSRKKAAATLSIVNGDGTKTAIDVSGHFDASNIPKSIENIKQATRTDNTKSYLDRNSKQEIYEKTINKNKYSGDYSLAEKRSVYSNGESSGRKKNAIVDNSLKSDTRVGNHSSRGYFNDDD